MKALLLLLAFVALAYCHEKEDLKHLDENPEFQRITSKWYAKYVEGLPLEKRAAIKPVPRDIQKAFSYNCIHDKILEKQNKQIEGIKIPNSPEPVNKVDKRAVGPIRFRLENALINSSVDPRACYSIGQIVQDASCVSNCPINCGPQDLLDDALKNLINNAASAVLDFFESALSIERTSGNLRLNQAVWNSFGRECFTDIDIPASYVSTGVPDTDMIVYFAARPVFSTGTVAYALTCNYDLVNGIKGRPLAGHVNFVPEQFFDFKSSSNFFEFQGAVKVGIHEFTHALGFSSSYYSSYRNPNTGNPWASTTITTCATPTLPIVKITTPRVVETARAHYGCPTLDGVQLEEIGGAGTSGSHWDRRVVGDEYMAGFINPIMPVSYLTLSLFEDMGFYKANYSHAEFWAWGKDQGCAWVDDRCENSWTNKPGYFCDNALIYGCSADRKGMGYCNVRDYSFALPEYYQHFSDPRRGGSDAAADHCPFIDVEKVDYCLNGERLPTSPSQVFGANSRCWDYFSVSNTTLQACWNHICNDSGLYVTYAGVDYLCPDAGGLIPNVGPSSNGILCPSRSLLCRIPNPPVGNLVTSALEKQSRKECEKNSANCFIATAAYGSPSEPHVWALRQFRDNYLAQNSLGRQFISWYYRVSPPIANWISSSETARFVVRSLLSPLVALVQLF